jgi:hypothetical protein
VAPVLAGLGGQVLAAATGALTRLRPTRKGLHPRGELRRARLQVLGSGAGSGVAVLEEAGTSVALVRLSRAIGTPAPLPDVQGLALRVGADSTAPDQGYDVLFASTGWRVPLRFLLTAGRSVASRPMTTLLPYRSADGPLLLGARFLDDDVVELAWSRGLGRWHRWARLVLGEAVPGLEVSFDPVLRPPPGLTHYDWVRALREPAYRDARAARTPS